MAHYAKIDENNIVVDVRVINNSDVEANGGEKSTQAEQWVSDNFGGGTWKQVSYNTKHGKYYDPSTGELDSDQTKAYRMNYPGIGCHYISSLDGFTAGPKPYDSWTVKQDTCTWEPPVAFPTITTTGVTFQSPEGVNYEQPYIYNWDEANQRWIAQTFTNDNVLENNYIWNSTTLQWEVDNG
jgi:hypothetical protein